MAKQIVNVTNKVTALRIANLSVLTASFVALVGLEQEPLGWCMLAVSFGLLYFADKESRRLLSVAHLPVLFLGLAPIGTSISQPFAFYMGFGLLMAVSLPYVIFKYIYREKVIVFPSLKESGWSRRRIGYLLLTFILAWLIFPIMLRSNDIYMNWELAPDFPHLLLAYLGLNAVGIWDELFFILTLLAIFSRLVPFIAANIFQAIFFASFLYAVGFESWAFIVVFFFALLQGYIYKTTKSLLFILAIHLTVDLVLHLALVYLHYPDKFPFFIT